jgi:hypothetical protein
VRWETPNPNITISDPAAKLPALAAGAWEEVPLVLTALDESREIVRVFAVTGAQRIPLDIRMYPPTEAGAEFRIADGSAASVYQRATDLQERTLGRGNGDGQVNPGESIAILIPDGAGYRAAEVLTDDFCVDRSARESDTWARYDNVGASVKVSLLEIRPDCAVGHVIRILTRVQLPNKPNHGLRYVAVDMPVVAPK